MAQEPNSKSKLVEGNLSISKDVTMTSSKPINFAQFASFFWYLIVIAFYLAQLFFFSQIEIDNRVHTFYFNSILILVVQIPFLIFLQYMSRFPLLKNGFLYKGLALIYVLANFILSLLVYSGVVNFAEILLPVYYFVISVGAFLLSTIYLFINRAEIKIGFRRILIISATLLLSQALVLISFGYIIVTDIDFSVVSPPTINIIIVSIGSALTILFTILISLQFRRLLKLISEKSWSNWFAFSSYVIPFLALICFSIFEWNGILVIDLPFILILVLSGVLVIYSFLGVWLLYKAPKYNYIYKFIFLFLIFVVLVSQVAAPISLGNQPLFPTINYVIGSGSIVLSLLIYSLAPNNRTINNKNLIIEIIGASSLVIFDTFIFLNILLGVEIINSFLPLDTIFLFANIGFSVILLGTTLFNLSFSK